MRPSSPVPAPVLYETVLRHVRAAPVRHAFTYRSYYWLVDLDHMPRLSWPLGLLAGFDFREHRGTGTGTLRSTIDAYLWQQGIDLQHGQILMLTQARVLGYVFNPLTVYWCHDADGELVCVVAEVHNTYGQQHRYLVQLDEHARAVADKVLYVSPFHPVAGYYRLSLPRPETRLALVVSLHRDGQPPFVASLHGRGYPATAARLLHLAARYPLTPLVGAARIRLQGLWLAARGVPQFAQPLAQSLSQNQPHHEGSASHRDSPDHPHPRRTCMTVSPPTHEVTATEPVDATRWPDVARVPHRPLLAPATAWLTQRALARTSIQTELSEQKPSPGRHSSAPLLQVHRPEHLYHRLAHSGLVGFGEAYLAGDWDSPDLVGLLTQLARDYDRLRPHAARWIRGSRVPRSVGFGVESRAKARHNIAHHYDLSNDLFALFLDETMTYSGALFHDNDPRDHQGLAAAQTRKIEQLLDATEVGPHTQLLEIGTGWGELAIRAAQRGAQVTTVTLSKAQAELARQRIAAADLSEQVQVRLSDYRDLTGRFDAVVSVEMIEAIGQRQWPVFCTALDRLVRRGGRVGLQTITMAHATMLQYRNDYSWMHKYVFPGGLIPSVYALEEQLSQRTALRITERHALGDGYADTLQVWRETFDARRDEVADLGFDATFQRLWRLYLAYSEAGFRSRILDVQQLIMERD